MQSHRLDLDSRAGVAQFLIFVAAGGLDVASQAFDYALKLLTGGDKNIAQMELVAILIFICRVYEAEHLLELFCEDVFPAARLCIADALIEDGLA